MKRLEPRIEKLEERLIPSTLEPPKLKVWFCGRCGVCDAKIECDQHTVAVEFGVEFGEIIRRLPGETLEALEARAVAAAGTESIVYLRFVTGTAPEPYKEQ